MANIINGTDTGSGGLITTGDSSDELQLQTAETARVTLTNTAVVVNEDGNDLDFRVEGDTDANTLFVDAGNDRVGVKTATPAVALDVVGQVRASTGILFGSDTAAANALDDYEEGSVSEPLEIGGSNQTDYYSNATLYTKIGNVVTYFVSFDLFNRTLVGTGALKINLPFTSSSVSGGEPRIIEEMAYGSASTNTGGATVTSGAYYIVDGSNYAALYTDITLGTAISAPDTNERYIFRFVITYRSA